MIISGSLWVDPTSTPAWRRLVLQKKMKKRAYRYDLNQISYNMEADEDCIPFYGGSYLWKMNDLKTFGTMVNAIPESIILIFNRGYDSSENEYRKSRTGNTLVGLFNQITWISGRFWWKKPLHRDK